jgi:hypothetical protein
MEVHKSPPELVALFTEVAPVEADVEYKKVFGFPEMM